MHLLLRASTTVVLALAGCSPRAAAMPAETASVQLPPGPAAATSPPQSAAAGETPQLVCDPGYVDHFGVCREECYLDQSDRPPDSDCTAPDERCQYVSDDGHGVCMVL